MFLHLMRINGKKVFTKPWVDMWEKVEPNANLYIEHVERSLSHSIEKSSKAGNTAETATTSDVLEPLLIFDVDGFHKIITNFDNIEGVILSGHYSCKYFLEIMNAIPRNIPICVFSWGDFPYPADFPDFFELTKKCYPQFVWQRRLKRRLANIVNPKSILGTARSFISRRLFHTESVSTEEYNDFLKRIDIFACSLKSEYQIFLKTHVVNPDMVYRYGTVGTPSCDRVKLCEGNSIQIGNSATFHNNHLDIFQIIKPIIKKGVKIVVPLTYGYSDYADFVVDKGRRLFGSDFVPLRKTLPYDEYQELLNQCGFYISGQTASTGLGNLYMALQRGAKTFLPKVSPCYSEYGNLGIPVFSLEDDLKGNPNAFTEFTEEEKLYCQNRYYENYNAERSIESCRNILAELRRMRAERANDPRFN